MKAFRVGFNFLREAIKTFVNLVSFVLKIA